MPRLDSNQTAVPAGTNPGAPPAAEPALTSPLALNPVHGVGAGKGSHLARELRALAELHWRSGNTMIAGTYHARALMIEAGLVGGEP